MSLSPSYSLPKFSVLQVARQRLALRGPAGFFSLSRRLRSAGYFRQAVPPSNSAISVAAAAVAAASSGVVNADSGGVRGPFLSLGGFKEALSEIGCGLTGKDLTNVFIHLDDGGRGEVTFWWTLRLMLFSGVLAPRFPRAIAHCDEACWNHGGIGLVLD